MSIWANFDSVFSIVSKSRRHTFLNVLIKHCMKYLDFTEFGAYIDWRQTKIDVCSVWQVSHKVLCSEPQAPKSWLSDINPRLLMYGNTIGTTSKATVVEHALFINEGGRLFWQLAASVSKSWILKFILKPYLNCNGPLPVMWHILLVSLLASSLGVCLLVPIYPFVCTPIKRRVQNVCTRGTEIFKIVSQ